MSEKYDEMVNALAVLIEAAIDYAYAVKNEENNIEHYLEMLKVGIKDGKKLLKMSDAQEKVDNNARLVDDFLKTNGIELYADDLGDIFTIVRDTGTDSKPVKCHYCPLKNVPF